MKKNAQKILLCLYTFSGAQQMIMPAKLLRLSVPDMSDSGFRSLLLFLERKNWLIRETIPGKQYISLTDAGRNALKAKFPALNDRWATWEGKWDCMVFIQAPKTDKQFRYLREILLSEHALPLTRGVYFSAGGYSSRVLEMCRSLYQDMLVIFSVEEWKMGLDRPIIVNYYDLAAVATVYSSISTEADKLLANLKMTKRRTDQQKATISTVIDRLWNSLRDDPGFTAYYFPGVPGIASLLPKLQHLILLWD